MNSLKGKIALVTGGSRGAGKAIAIELGKAGAVVYVTGRSTKRSSPHDFPGTIEDTAAEIQAAGGKGIGVVCDHTNAANVEELIKRIDQEQGRLDILVNNVWGGNELSIDAAPFWELPLEHWDNMFTSGVRAQLTANYFAIPLLRKNRKGLIVHTSFWDHDKYIGNFYYDLSKNALNRMAYGLSVELKNDNIAVVAVSPGFMRTELVLKSFQTDEDHWQKITELASSETPHYVGRAVAALAGDPQILSKTGQILRAGDLAKEYQFTDIDGRVIPPFEI
ncbi:MULTISPECIES: SDR family NAD(P)-dependent oxidoreductase [Bacillus]|uniref:Oxidoreductase n=2 Tax=Bacillus TaxID=1386 RepID=A0A0M5JFS7_9BACI|nr:MULTISPECIES: SDR family NAD(P)-dependent oxidoreductase [Bacillus]ALC80351.1 oxidoreductase [Bacillus gobiensis]MBP1083805.1 NAD(P)-dependent dehydrogenase (short-subunit alcohol dehydrogenase family) [Bacillus capparidis]MED1098290.1 SDR family NAD(P)-dependent oxidoreductase [Bacillus capparidis]